MERLIIENGVYYIKETPDDVVVGKKRTPIMQWNSDKFAFPFGYINGKMKIGHGRTMHDQLGTDRSNMKYPGRLWLKKKIISFWQYPSTSELKKILSDFEHTFNNIPMDGPYENKSKAVILGREYGKIHIDGSWKLDVPGRAASDDENYDGFVTRTNGMKIIPRSEYDHYGYLYSLNTIYSNKPLKGVGEKLRSGENVNTDTGQQHVNSPLLKRDSFSKMTEKQKRDIYNYFKSKGRLSPDEKRMWQVLNKENVDIYCDGERFLIKENPDVVVVGHGEKVWLPDRPPRSLGKLSRGKSIAAWRDSDAIPFGFKNGKCYFGENGRTHADIQDENGIEFDGRKSFKYPGRLWYNKKIISFWGYPPFSKLKGVLAEIERSFNKLGYSKVSLIDWKLDIPRTNDPDESVDGLRSSKIFRDVVGWDESVSTYVYDTTLLYSIRNVLGDKPLRGVGKPWKERGLEINTDKGQEHMKPAALKNKNIQRLDKKGKEDLWNYFKNKGGGLDPEEKRMYSILQQNMKRENIDMFINNGKIIIIENKPKKYFTLEEGTGILRRVL